MIHSKSIHLVKGVVFLTAIALTLVTFIGILVLPGDLKGDSPFNKNLWVWWLAVGTMHCLLVVILLAYALIIRKKKGKRISLELYLVIGIAIIWIALVASWTKLGYLRNKPMYIPKNHPSTNVLQEQ